MSTTNAMARHSNAQARKTWEVRAVGSQRSQALKGSPQYFDDIRAYRYGYETPFIPRLFEFDQLAGKSVLEIGIGNGIDAVEMARHGARYTGLDITENHLRLTAQNFAANLPGYDPPLIHGDLLETDFIERFDRIYSFGVLHHIAHEELYLRRMKSLLAPDGKLMIAVYSRWSFFNAYMIARWLGKPAAWSGALSLDDWRSHFAEASLLGEPVTIKIRSRRAVERTLQAAGFSVVKYAKQGFVQNYLPVVGKYLHAEGPTLRTLGHLFGWYHIFHCV